MNSASLGHRINIARKERGLTSEKLSEMCNINATYLRQIEGGAKTPSLPVFVTICQKLDVSPHYLLAEDFLENTEIDSTILTQLLKTATPKQSALICKMIQSAVDFLETN